MLLSRARRLAAVEEGSSIASEPSTLVPSAPGGAVGNGAGGLTSDASAGGDQSDGASVGSGSVVSEDPLRALMSAGSNPVAKRTEARKLLKLLTTRL